MHRWGRYEIENYLIHPELLKRHLGSPKDLFEAANARTDQAEIDRVFAENFPTGIDWLGDLPVLREIKGSAFLVNALLRTSRALAKRDLFMLAARATASEIHPEVVRVLDLIAAAKPAVVPFVAANEAPDDADGVEGTPELGDDS